MSKSASIVLMTCFDKEKPVAERVKSFNDLKQYFDQEDVHKEVLQKYFDQDVEIRRTIIGLLFSSSYTNESVALASDYITFFEKMIYEENEEDLRLTAFRRYFDDIKHSKDQDLIMANLFVYEINEQMKSWSLSFLQSHKIDQEVLEFIKEKGLQSLSPNFYTSYLQFLISYDENLVKELLVKFLESTESHSIVMSLIKFSFQIKDWDENFLKNLQQAINDKNDPDLRTSFYKSALLSNQFSSDFIDTIVKDLVENDMYGFISTQMSELRDKYPEIGQALINQYSIEESVLNKEHIIRFFSSSYSEEILNIYFKEENSFLKNQILMSQKPYAGSFSEEILSKLSGLIAVTKDLNTLTLILALLDTNQSKVKYGEELFQKFFKEERSFAKRSLYGFILNLNRDQVTDKNTLMFCQDLLEDKFFFSYQEILKDLSQIEDTSSEEFKGLLLSLSKKIYDQSFLKDFDALMNKSALSKDESILIKANLLDRFIHLFPMGPLDVWMKEMGSFKGKIPEVEQVYTKVAKGAELSEHVTNLDKDTQKDMFLGQFSKMMEDQGLKGFSDLEGYLDKAFDAGTIKKSDAVKIIKASFDWHQDYPGLVNLITKFTKGKVFEKEIVNEAIDFLAIRPTGESWGTHGASSVSYTLEKYINGYISETKDFSVLDVLLSEESYETFYKLGIEKMGNKSSGRWDLAADWWLVNSADWILEEIDDLPDEWLLDNALKPLNKNKPSYLQSQYYFLRVLSKKVAIVSDNLDKVLSFYKEQKNDFDVFFIDRLQSILWAVFSRDSDFQESKKDFYELLCSDLKERNNIKINEATKLV